MLTNIALTATSKTAQAPFVTEPLYFCINHPPGTSIFVTIGSIAWRWLLFHDRNTRFPGKYAGRATAKYAKTLSALFHGSSIIELVEIPLSFSRKQLKHPYFNASLSWRNKSLKYGNKCRRIVLRQGDIKAASKYGKFYELQQVTNV